jgi:predicted nucleic acid-binding protein
MNVLFDTNAVIALIVSDHKDHSVANKAYQNLTSQKADLYISAHTILELYSTLTKKGIKFFQFSPNLASDIIENEVLKLFSVVEMGLDDYLNTLYNAVEHSVLSANIYDAFIVQAQKKADCEFIVTFNVKHFDKLARIYKN